ncbi:MAG: transglutaminase TgpA family protein [Pseudanabaena sp.]|jgi:transglutaminase-like putative cysteine protease
MNTIQPPAKKISTFEKLRQASDFTLTGVEDSIPLRILVQIFVFISIGTMDSVASTNNSAWGIPLSAIAAVWAWYARRKRNVLVKLFIAIAMIAMLVVFLRDIVSQAEETRLLLAGLLIQLQVLHSFDLPRRKDLGYSIVIGLILMALAATLSQTMFFAIWLLAFLLVGIPILLLDHRSRLGVKTISFQPEKMGISPLPLAGLMAIVMVLGLTIFAFLPRLPGFQLRNFPVSVNLQVERKIPRGGILTRQQQQNQQQQQQQQSGANSNGGNGSGGTGGKDDLESLPPLFAPEIDTVSDGAKQVSKKREPELMMRVRSQAELFWRVMAYDEYTGKGWRISRNDPNQINTIRRSPFNYEFFLPTPIYGLIGNKQTFKPVTFQEVVQTYTITSSNFPNLIPMAAVPNRVFFPSEELDIDLEGTVRAPSPLPPDLTYTVISNVVQRNPQQLRQLPQEYPKLIRNFYLNLPAGLSPQVRETALSFLENAKTADGQPIAFNNAYDATVQITQSLKQKYAIKPLNFDPAKNPSKSDLVSQFVEQGGGEESHFVSTLAVMLRSLGIPTRYVVGFAPGKFNPFTGLYEVQNIDTQSLVEVYFPVYGWLAFDPVPNRPLFPPSIETSRTFGVIQTIWNWIANFIPSPVNQFFSSIFDNIGKFLGGVISWLFEMGWIGLGIGLAIGFGFAIGGWALWQLAIWWWQLQRLQKMPIPQRTYQQMLQWLSEQGKSKLPHQTPQEYVASLRDRVSDQQVSAIAQITQIYQDWRYGNLAIGYSVTLELKMLLQQLKTKI